MIEDPFIKWAKSELKRLEREEEWEKIDKELEERKQIKRERYLNAPVMNLDGKIVGCKSLSTGEKA